MENLHTWTYLQLQEINKLSFIDFLGLLLLQVKFECPKCSIFKLWYDFPPDYRLRLGLDLSRCRVDKRQGDLDSLMNTGNRRLNNRKVSEKDATPWWVDYAGMVAHEKERRRLTEETGILHAKDHIIPLNHPDVCGLNIPINIQVITWMDNCKKSNHFNQEEHSNWTPRKATFPKLK